MGWKAPLGWRVGRVTILHHDRLAHCESCVPGNENSVS